jgi:cytochrome c oxidase cbb3-type subunit 3
VSHRLVLLLMLAAACQREARSFDSRTYSEAAWDIGEGKGLYDEMNCGGCHARGGGDLGPPLMDAAWRYGSSSAAVVSSILDGRPRGMPAFKSRLTVHEAQEVAAYVRALGGLARTDAVPARDDHMAVTPPPSMVHHGVPLPSKEAP